MVFAKLAESNELRTILSLEDRVAKIINSTLGSSTSDENNLFRIGYTSFPLQIFFPSKLHNIVSFIFVKGKIKGKIHRIIGLVNLSSPSIEYRRLLNQHRIASAIVSCHDASSSCLNEKATANLSSATFLRVTSFDK